MSSEDYKLTKPRGGRPVPTRPPAELLETEDAMDDPQQTPDERASDCSLEVMSAIKKTLTEYRPRLKPRYSIGDDYVHQAHGIALPLSAVDEYEEMQPVRLEPAKRRQLYAQVRYLIVGAIAEHAIQNES